MTEMMLPVSSLQPNKFNPNVMQDEEFQALKKDMQKVGPKKIDSVLVSLYCDFYPCEDNEDNRKKFANSYVIVDGEHRWTGATELCWASMRCDIQVLDEEEAKGICYRKNKDRGTIDPFKEAALFHSELELLSQKEIAEKFLVDPSTVSHRLSLLKLVPEVRKQVEDLPRGMITPSHLEPIASLPEGEQKKISLQKQWEKGEIRSVRDISEETKRIKEALAAEQALKKALETAKYPKCPKCGQGACRSNYKGLPWVNCASGKYEHDWNLETGKSSYEIVTMQQNKVNGEKAEPVKTKVIRCVHTVDELSEAFVECIRQVIPNVEKITSFRVHGKLFGDEDFSAEFSGYGQSMNVSLSVNHKYCSFRAEVKDYKTGEKTMVDAGSPDDVERVKQFIENAFQGTLEVPDKKPKRLKMPSEEAAS